MSETRENAEQSTDYRSTLNLPSTAFPMRGNLPKREPQRLRQWAEKDLYRRLQDERRDARPFVLHDGPPYANGNIHLGTALNKILKDFVVKFRTMAGWRAPYVPGWDCHGLPIELQVERNLGRKERPSKSEFRARCREYANRFIAIQREEFRRLGVLGAWDRPYLTMDSAYEAAEVRAFGQFLESGAVYRGHKPVLWCPSCATALAEAEVEYQEHTSPSVYVDFPLKGPLPEPVRDFAGWKPGVAIWTTTPWTLPANVAIAVHADFRYVLVEVRGRALVVAKELLESFLAEVGEKEYRLLAEFRGEELEGARTIHPWLDRDSVLVLSDAVSLVAGTGCVHTAPGHGQEDYEVGLRYGLDVYAPVDGNGRFTSEVEDFAGQFVFDADAAIVGRLREKGRLLKGKNYVHNYPHCWRCKNPVVFRATSQWFVSMEAGGLREKALAEIERVRWIPSWGRDRIRGMMEARPDWCISRQRNWGVPIVAFYCQGCGEVLATREIADHVASIFERDGSDVWYMYSIGELLPSGTKCPSCGSEEFRREEDILDVWFDSGLSHQAVLGARGELSWPADLYLEGSDQHRGWFHSSLLTALVTNGRAPYEAVLTHGFTVDAENRKMSKSLGNDVKPQEVIERYGAEILRLWVAAEDYRGDMRLSEEIFGRLVESYRRIRNTARFLLANLSDFDPVEDAVPAGQWLELDRWIVDRTAQLVGRCREAYENYEFHVVYHGLNNFCAVELSSLYLDIVKDRLYCSGADAPDRRAAQTAMAHVLDRIARLLAPILSFTAEEIWEHMPTVRGRPDSVFLAGLPEVGTGERDPELAETWQTLLDVRGAVTKVLEDARKQKRIGHSLEARVRLGCDQGTPLANLLESRRQDLPALFIVSQVVIDPELPEETRSALVPALRIRVDPAEGAKCARCWNYRLSVGENAEQPALCERCVQVLAA